MDIEARGSAYKLQSNLKSPLIITTLTFRVTVLEHLNYCCISIMQWPVLRKQVLGNHIGLSMEE